MESHGATKSKRRQRSSSHRRVFTLDHAVRTLPLVKRIVSDIVKQYKVVSSLEEECHVPTPKSAGDVVDALRDRYNAELDKLRDLAAELTSVGCELKDWRRGLVDFPARHDGRDVYFCWRLGEDTVSFWHDVDSGFQGRRPIDAAFAAPSHDAPAA